MFRALDSSRHHLSLRCVSSTWLVLRYSAVRVSLIFSTEVPAELLAEGAEIGDLHSAPEGRQLICSHVRDPIEILTKQRCTWECLFLVIYCLLFGNINMLGGNFFPFWEGSLFFIYVGYVFWGVMFLFGVERGVFRLGFGLKK